MKRSDPVRCAAAAIASTIALAGSAQAQQTERPPAGEPVTGVSVMTPGGWTDRYWRAPDGTWFHYVEMGSGAPVILLHGLGSNHAVWLGTEMVQALAKTNRVIALDMRYARRAPELTAPPPGSHPQDLLAFMDALGIRKAHIGGYSMGGGTVLGLMQAAPERFITAHIGGAGPGETAEQRDKVARDPIPEAISCGNLGLRTADWQRPAADAPAYSGSSATAAGLIYVGCGPPATYAGDLTQIRFPIFSIVGEFDAPNYVTHRLQREVKDFRRLVLKGRDHMTAMRSPEYREALAAFIAAHNKGD